MDGLLVCKLLQLRLSICFAASCVMCEGFCMRGSTPGGCWKWSGLSSDIIKECVTFAAVIAARGWCITACPFRYTGRYKVSSCRSGHLSSQSVGCLLMAACGLLVVQELLCSCSEQCDSLPHQANGIHCDAAALQSWPLV